jgi:Tol biopolymer transport system component
MAGRFSFAMTAAGASFFGAWMGGNKRTPIGPDGSAGSAALSPYGDHVAFDSDESGRQEVYIQAIPPASGKWQISVAGGAWPRWRADGSELSVTQSSTYF